MLEVKAYAKINLFLDIESKRADGYHNIKSIMQSIDWCDIIKIEKNVTKKSVIISSSDKSLPTDASNIVYRVAKAFFELIETEYGVSIYIEKNIPASSGMAGGSADGASVLKGMNLLFGEPFTLNELIQISKQIGADIPFCIVGGTKIIGGIGDVIEDCPDIPNCYIVCAKDDNGAISTPLAYHKLDEMYNNFQDYTHNDNYSAMVEAIYQSDLSRLCKLMFNVFESVIDKSECSVSLIKKIMHDNGAISSLMSGSGPSVIGIFDSEEKAAITTELLINQGITARSCKPIFL